jgi:cysteine desulfurase
MFSRDILRSGVCRLTIYLDNLAGTPVDPRVVARHAEVSAALAGNPNSVEHAGGQRAHSVLEDARTEVAEFLSSPEDDVMFTPSASMALWIAVQDAIERSPGRPPRILASAVEHPALLKHLTEAGRQGRADVTLFPVDRMGQPDLAALRCRGRDGIDLVCMMAANNETGTVTALSEVITEARECGARILVDVSQAAGRIDLAEALVADHVVLCGAKMYGPRGVGVLAGPLSRRTRDVAAAMLGSPDAAGAAAFALACKLRAGEMKADEARITGMRDRLEARLLARVPGLSVNGDPGRRLAGALHVSVPNVPGDAVAARLWGKVDVSTGAACQSGAPGPSHVLSAMGVTDAAAVGAVRIGIGRFNTDAEIDAAAHLLTEAMTASPNRLRRSA